jgi:DNA repair ATPase RecN
MKKYLPYIQLSILLVLPISTYADVASSSASIREPSVIATVSTTTPEATTTPDQDFTICQQQAIEERDTLIASSRVLYNTAMANALTERKNNEKAAIAITDKNAKKVALKNSVDTYKNIVKNAQDDLTQARKDAWQTFEDTIQSCHDIQDSANEYSSATSTDSSMLGTGGIQTMINAIKSLFDKE